MLEKFLLGKRILESNFKRLKEPYKLTFAVTYKCNSRCKTCNIWKKEVKNELRLKEIKRIFESINPSWIDLTGGEIFLREDIFELIKTIHENSELYLLHFPTNGLLVDKITETLEKIKQLSIPKFVVSISLDGPKEIHDEIRGVKGNFEKAVQTYKNLKDLGIESYFGLTLSEFNIGKYEETLESLKRQIENFKDKELHVNLYHTSEHYYSNPKEFDRRKLIKDVEKCIEKRKGIHLNPIKFLEYKYIEKARNYIKNGKTPLSCKSLTSSCFIDPKGNVYPCSIYNKKLGNLRNNDYNLKKIWNSEKTKKIQREIEGLKCPNCWTPCEAYQTILGNLIS